MCHDWDGRIKIYSYTPNHMMTTFPDSIDSIDKTYTLN